MYRSAPDRAKADLKKQLNLHNVRKGIASQILSRIESTPGPDSDMAASTRSLPAFEHDPHFVEAINSEAARPPPPEEIPMDPIYLHSQRELEDLFREMQPHFEGKESEENWILRDRSVTKLRRLTKGNAPTDYHGVYMAGIKQLQDGIIKVANSLRTTMSSNGCHLVQELARTLGPALDPMVEIYLQNFVKMSSFTKNIAAQNGNQTADTLFQYVSYNVRIMQHIWLAAQDKNVQPRTFCAGWLRTLLSRQTGSKTHFEHSGGLELAEKTIKKCLNDPQPKVREGMRATFWTFAKTWPDKAAAIMATLDTKAQAALERDPNNPNAPATAPATTLRAATTSRAQSRSSVRDAMLAARRNQMKAPSDRPNSAMAAPSHSPVRSKSTANLTARQPSTSTTKASRIASSASSTAPSTEAASGSSSASRPNSLMSGAARRPVRKPEMPRPATAEPWASRRLMRPETPSNKSPAHSPRQDTAVNLARSVAASASRKKLEAGSPAVSSIRASPRSGIPSPKQTGTSPRVLPRSRPTSKDGKVIFSDDTVSVKEDDFSIIIPSRSRLASPLAGPSRPSIDKTFSVDSGIQVLADDENLTMVMPARNGTQQLRSPIAAIHAPVRSQSEEPSGIPSPLENSTSISEPVPRQSGRSESMSVPRQSSPLKAFTSAPSEGFQIHEDPFSATSPTPSQEPRALNEVPINESSQPAQTNSELSGEASNGVDHLNEMNQNGTISPPMTPESKTEMMRSRKLLISGIDRIRSRTLDAHGFRKVLELIRSSGNGEIFGSVGEGRRFDELCGALLDYIIEPIEGATGHGRQSQELKRQATTVLRTVLNNQQPAYKKWISSGRWLQRTLAGVFDARKSIEGLGILIKDLETLSSDVATRVHPEEGERAVLAWLEADQESHIADGPGQQDGVAETKIKSQEKATALALRTLGLLISRGVGAPIRADISARIASVAAVCLRSEDAEIRKSAVETVTQLHAMWPSIGSVDGDGDSDGKTKNDFWTLLDKSGVQESARNLIVYFIARRERA